MSTAPGWYPSPQDPKLEQLWDGEQWVGEPRASGSSITPTGRVEHPRSGTPVAIGLLALIVLILIVVYSAT